MKFIVGLGNPGEEYKNTRHNTGRIVLDVVRKTLEGSDWEFNKIYNAQVSLVKIGKEKGLFLLPETFMNKSGSALRKLVTSAKKAKDLVVFYDDLDLPMGRLKISYNKSSGGHKGLESIIREVKTLEFSRFRIGIAPKTSGGKIKKPSGEEKVEKHIMGGFNEEDMKTLKKLGKKSAEALVVLCNEGWEKAASLYSNIEV